MATPKHLHDIMRKPSPEEFDGKPFYCTTCWRGFFEFMECAEWECCLESASEARQRQAQHQGRQKGPKLPA